MDQWPEQYLSTNKLSDIEDVQLEVESFFSDMYECEAMFFPSARSSLYHLSIFYEIGRNQEIVIPRWSSHCLYNAFGLIGTPSVHTKNPKLILLNHKWGYLHSTEGAARNIPIIEDSVDSLILNKKGLFQRNGEFEIISLSKLLGLPGGCIVFMKSKESKRQLTKIVEQKNNSELNAIFWSHKKKYFDNGKVNQHEFQVANQLEPLISRATSDQLMNFKGIEKKYLEALKVISERYCKVLCHKNKLKLESQVFFQNDNRVPTIIPVHVTEDILLELSNRGIKLEKRNFDFNLNAFSPNFKPTYFLPIHIGVSDRDFDILISIIFKQPNL
tara:strand:- start:2972 stop:3958 length:987 start_codon:yes stop_codon:yes gene_type:complete